MVNKRIIALSNQLRKEGISVSIRSTQTACYVWDIMKTYNLNNMKYALSSVYVKDHHDYKKFNKVYEELFQEIELHEELIKDKSENSSNEEDYVINQDIEETITSIENFIPNEFDMDLQQQQKIHENDLLKTDINHINTFDERIFDLCRKLGLKIANERSRRRKRMQTNNIDMPHTIRSNMKNGGKLINLYKSKPHVKKSKHIFLSDVSGSCDWISSWFFSILYGCQKSFDKINTYEFDNKIINTTDELNTESFFESYENVINLRMKRGMLHGQSNMANAFKEFQNDVRLNHRTMVILLTDCRDWGGKRENGILESATILREIAKQSSKVIIFNPESKIRWTTRTSCVQDYLDAGAEIYEIKNLDNLTKLITQL